LNVVETFKVTFDVSKGPSDFQKDAMTCCWCEWAYIASSIYNELHCQTVILVLRENIEVV